MKFRLWDSSRNEMVYNSPYKFITLDGKVVVDGIVRDYYKILRGTSVSDQYGNEIYEGDMINIYPTLDENKTLPPFLKINVTSNNIQPWAGYLIEVIGNIYENHLTV